MVNHARQLRLWREQLSRDHGAGNGAGGNGNGNGSGASPEEAVAAYRLTPRELTVLSLVAESLTTEAIGRRLRISPRTVHKHIEHLYRKMGTADRLSTVLRARTEGLLGEGPTVPPGTGAR